MGTPTSYSPRQGLPDTPKNNVGPRAAKMKDYGRQRSSRALYPALTAPVVVFDEVPPIEVHRNSASQYLSGEPHPTITDSAYDRKMED
jgi:hypothetical protein